jgi:hypothetical protein
MNCLGKQAMAIKSNGTKLDKDGGQVNCRDINMIPKGTEDKASVLMLAREISLDYDATTNTGFNDGSIFMNLGSSGSGVNGNTILRLANVPIGIDAGVTPTIPTKIGVDELYIDSDGYVRQRLV